MVYFWFMQIHSFSGSVKDLASSQYISECLHILCRILAARTLVIISSPVLQEKHVESELNQQRFHLAQFRVQLPSAVALCRLSNVLWKLLAGLGGVAAGGFHKLSALESTSEIKTTLTRHFSISWDIEILRSFRNHSHLCWRDWNMQVQVFCLCRYTKAKHWYLHENWYKNQSCQKHVSSPNHFNYLLSLALLLPSEYSHENSKNEL